MKKIASAKYIIFTFFMMAFTLFLKTEIVSAAVVNVNASAVDCIVGDSVTITIECQGDYYATTSISVDSDIVSGEIEKDKPKNINLADTSASSSKYTFTLKTLKSGTVRVVCTPYFVATKEGEVLLDTEGGVGNASDYTQVVTITVSDPPIILSSDNKLSALTLMAGDEVIALSPEFSGGTKDYEAEVLNHVQEISVSTKLNHSAAWIESVSGNKNLEVGDNYIKIKVVAEDGSSRTYTIKVRRLKENQEIGAPEVTEEDAKFSYQNQVYVSVKEAIPNVKIPAMFTTSVITVNNVQYPCFFNEAQGMVIMYLCPEGKKDGALYYYNSETGLVEPFVFFEHNNQYIVPLPSSRIKEVPNGYEMKEFTIDGVGLVTGFQKLEVSGTDSTENNYFLVYAINSEGNFDYYQYDKVEGTYQRYEFEVEEEIPVETETETELDTEPVINSDEKNKSLDLEKLYFILLIGAIAIILILGIIIFVLLKSQNSDDDYYDDDDDDDDDNGDDDNGDDDNDDDVDKEEDTENHDQSENDDEDDDYRYDLESEEKDDEDLVIVDVK